MRFSLLHNRKLIQGLYSKNKPICKVEHRVSCTRPPEVVFLEKLLEEPVLVKSENDNVDLIGPPDPDSNLRPIIRTHVLNETVLEQKLRQLQDETQRWNQAFWAEHNKKFISERNDYVKRHLKPDEDRSTLTADEMSEFYKSFLDKYWQKHVNYNIEWYKKNFTLLLLALRVNLQQLLRS